MPDTSTFDIASYDNYSKDTTGNPNVSLVEPLTRKTSYVIVGLDPGTTVGLSILDLDGNLLHIASVRAQSPAEVIAEISRIGKPVVVATDKAEMPAGVEKIRRAFAAVSWTPKKDILIKEKYAAAEGYPFADDHQRDSLAAAVLCQRGHADSTAWRDGHNRDEQSRSCR